ncbi:hypothetical protein [Absiella sp. AM29-15]|uniref:hypothetical protein n=1 Tax=Absiella sp. AM29-15 TaxID=2292278 RepID=UPI000E41C8DE|nr:hypothetical protein [Absiella sp. AM29-15]RGC51456.1 hypothetical protein DW761_10635 [Absiella sp. AM29-15]
MKNLITTELKKYILLKRVLIAFLFVISIFIIQIFTVSATTASPYTLSIAERGSFHNIQEEIKRIKTITFSQTVIDENFKDEYVKEYKRFVDKNILDKESLMENAKNFNMGYEELYKERYDIQESGLIFSENIKYSQQMSLFFDKYAAIYNKEHMLEQCIKATKHMDENYLTQKQIEDLTSIIQKHMSKPYIQGYHLGFDYLIGNLQFLPFTLGLLLIICFYGMFGREKARKTDTLILTSKFGKNEYIKSKMITIWIVASIAWLTFQIVNIIGCWFMFGLDGALVSVYSDSFISPYGLNYIQYYGILLIVSYFGTLLFSLLVCISSQLLKSIPTLCLGIIFVITTGWLINSCGNVGLSLFNKLMLLLPTQMMSANTFLSEYISIQISNWNLRLPILYSIVLIIGIPLSGYILYRITKNRQIKN